MTQHTNTIQPKTKKAFREYLNNKYGYSIDKRGSLQGASKRLYGDYLYAADKEVFDIQYNEWLQENDQPTGADDGELREQLEQILNWTCYRAKDNPDTINKTISRIGELLAAATDARVREVLERLKDKFDNKYRSNLETFVIPRSAVDAELATLTPKGQYNENTEV